MYIGPSIIRSLLIFCSIAASSPLPATLLVGHIEVVLVVCKVALLYRSSCSSSSRAAPASSSSALGRTFGASFLLFTFGEGENSFHFEVKPGRGTRARARDSAMQGSWREEQSRASAAVLAASNAMSKNTLLRQYVAEPTAAASCSSLAVVVDRRRLLSSMLAATTTTV